jgi:hypothetical protein
LGLHGKGIKPPSPLEFNSNWLKEQYFPDLFHNLWIPYGHNSLVYERVHFVENLKRVKQETITWAHAKKEREEKELRD